MTNVWTPLLLMLLAARKLNGTSLLCILAGVESGVISKVAEYGRFPDLLLEAIVILSNLVLASGSTPTTQAAISDGEHRAALARLPVWEQAKDSPIETQLVLTTQHVNQDCP